jgi:hypothetical protein
MSDVYRAPPVGSADLANGPVADTYDDAAGSGWVLTPHDGRRAAV